MREKLGMALMAAVAMTLLFAGCQGGDKAKLETLSDLAGKVVGFHAFGAPQEFYEKIVAEELGAKPKQVVTFNRESDNFAALQAGKIDAAYTISIAADYYAKRNAALKVIPGNLKMKFLAVMALRQGDGALRDTVDKALTTLEANGGLRKLQEEWITNLPAGNEPAAKEIPRIPNARTVRVGVCGDDVPMDYIAADGRPAGFNVALFTEIGKLANLNFEFVSLESQAKYAALQGGKIDVIFVHLQVENNVIAGDFAKPDKSLTKPYFSFSGNAFVVKK